MAHVPDHSHPQTRVVLLGDQETLQHRADLADDAARRNCVVVAAFGFDRGGPGSTDDLTEIDGVVQALGRAIADRMELWIPFPGPDFFWEQHWRRLSLVMQRHGLNVRAGRDLAPCPTDGGGYNEIDYALRREVRAVDDLDNAALAAVGVSSLGREIERALATAGSRVSVNRQGSRPAAEGDPDPLRRAKPAGTPTLPVPTAPWKLRQPALKHYVRWLVHGCGVTQAATARVLNSTGQRTPRGRLWQPASVSKLLNGQYDLGAAGARGG